MTDRMAELGVSVGAVVNRDDTGELVGLINQFDLLRAREKLLVEERHTERILTLKRMAGRRDRDESISVSEFVEPHEESEIE